MAAREHGRRLVAGRRRLAAGERGCGVTRWGCGASHGRAGMRRDVSVRDYGESSRHDSPAEREISKGLNAKCTLGKDINKKNGFFLGVYT